MCVYCGTAEGVVQHSKRRLCCRDCNRDITYYHVWRRKVKAAGISVAAHEVANLKRRIELLQLAAKSVVSDTHVRWCRGKGTRGRHPGGMEPIEEHLPGTKGKTKTRTDS